MVRSANATRWRPTSARSACERCVTRRRNASPNLTGVSKRSAANSDVKLRIPTSCGGIWFRLTGVSKRSAANSEVKLIGCPKCRSTCLPRVSRGPPHLFHKVGGNAISTTLSIENRRYFRFTEVAVRVDSTFWTAFVPCRIDCTRPADLHWWGFFFSTPFFRPQVPLSDLTIFARAVCRVLV